MLAAQFVTEVTMTEVTSVLIAPPKPPLVLVCAAGLPRCWLRSPLSDRCPKAYGRCLHLPLLVCPPQASQRDQHHQRQHQFASFHPELLRASYCDRGN